MEIACPLLRLPGALSASLLALDRQDFAVLATWQKGRQSAHADTSKRGPQQAGRGEGLSWLQVFTNANTAHLGHSGDQER